MQQKTSAMRVDCRSTNSICIKCCVINTFWWFARARAHIVTTCFVLHLIKFSHTASAREERRPSHLHAERCTQNRFRCGCTIIITKKNTDTRCSNRKCVPSVDVLCLAFCSLSAQWLQTNVYIICTGVSSRNWRRGKVTHSVYLTYLVYTPSFCTDCVGAEDSMFAFVISQSQNQY